MIPISDERRLIWHGKCGTSRPLECPLKNFTVNLAETIQCATRKKLNFSQLGNVTRY